MINELINGRYKVISRLGDGGMAMVYKAKDLILDRLVAVKILRHEFSEDGEFIRRFRREAEAVASLSHPNIVNIYDIGEEEDLYYIVMEFVDGMTLKDMIREYGPLPAEEAVNIGKRIAAAIEHAHQHGIVHRDIKPHNILIGGDGEVKVTDFGIALAMTSATITYTNSIMGSAHYLSPEQAKGDKSTIKSDIYALGVVLYEMVTGILPYPGQSPVTVALKHLNDPYQPPTEIIDGLPQSIENIIAKAMAKDPEERFSSIGELYDDLNTALSPERLYEAPLVLQSAAMDPEATKKMAAFKENSHREAEGESDRTMAFPGVTSSETSEEEPEETHKGKKEPKKKRKKWPIFISILVVLLIGAVLSLFFILPDMTSADKVNVPDLSGKTYEEAAALLKDKGLKAEKSTEKSNKVEKDHIIRQSPDGGSQVDAGSSVTLTVSSGPDTVKVDGYVGYEEDKVREILKDSAFKTVNWVQAPSDEYGEGIVMAQDPEEGSDVVAEDTDITLTVSSGPASVDVPDFSGMSKDEAKSEADKNGLDVEFKDGDFSDVVEAGKVLSQDPGASASVDKGTTITLYLSKGKKAEPVTVEREVTVEVPDQAPPADKKGPQDKKGKDKKDTGDGPASVHVQIYYTDADHPDQTVFKDETITNTKTYTIPLTVAPDGEAAYQVICDGEVIKDEKVDYKQAEKETKEN